MRKEASGSIRSELAIRELILPLDVKGPPPKFVFASDLYFDLLLHALPFAEQKLYQR